MVDQAQGRLRIAPGMRQLLLPVRHGWKTNDGTSPFACLYRGCPLRGFTEAGKRIFATQSTVSKMVKQLEEELGVQLIDRSGPRARPTEPGLMVYQRGLDMLAMRDELLTRIGEFDSLKRGVLRMGVPTVGGDMLFAPVLAEFRRRYPLIQIKLIEHGSAHLHEILRAGDLDVAGILLPVTQELDHRPVRREPVVALVPEGFSAGADLDRLARPENMVVSAVSGGVCSQ
jgi:DNA-binding transcriptional LysR family regulator